MNHSYAKSFLLTLIIAISTFGILISQPAYGNGWGWPSGMHAAVSITYDDGSVDNLDNAIPALEDYGYRGTFYLTKDIVINQDRSTGRDLITEWRQAFLNGHEIGSHGIAHICKEVTGDYNNSQTLVSEVYGSKLWLDSVIGVDPIRSYAYPCGETKAYIETNTLSDTYYPYYVSNHYFVARTGKAATNKPSELRQNRVLINGYPITNDQPSDLTYIKDILTNAALTGDWVVFVFHSVSNDPKTVLPVSTAFHNSVLKYLYDEGIYWVAPVRDVANYIVWF